MKKRFVVEIVEEKKAVLFSHRVENKIVRYLRFLLQKDHVLYETGMVDADKTHMTKSYDMGIFVGFFPEEKTISLCKSIIIILMNDEGNFSRKKRWCEKNLSQYKLVNIGRTDRTVQDLCDFILFKTPFPYVFSLSKQIEQKPYQQKKSLSGRDALRLVLLYLISCAVGLNLLFFIFFAIQGALLIGLSKTDRGSLPTLNTQTSRIIGLDKLVSVFVLIPKNTLFWVPGIEYVFQLQLSFQKTTGVISKATTLLEEYRRLSYLFLRPNKTIAESKEISLRLAVSKKTLNDFGDIYFDTLAQWKKTPPLLFPTKQKKLIDTMEQYSGYISLARQLTSELPELLGSTETRRYLFLFMNNMELRPGGGFIGSVGVAEFSHYSLSSLRIYDVYSLDGQLRLHYDPPAPIRTYLDQPHLFVRDAAFSPDFGVSAGEVEKLIDTEVGWGRFDGVVAVTFTAVQKLIGIFPDFYISSYDEWITPDNFFIKAQTYAEDRFFPGSHGKKNFLEAVVKTAQTKLQEGAYDFAQLLSIGTSLFDEKQVVVRFLKESLQSSFDELFWTGRVIKPGCNVSTVCFFDYLMVVDANLGVNKANFFVQRSVNLTTTIDRDRQVSNTLSVLYQNNSIERIFPGGIYKNYIQIYIPQETIVRHVAIDGESVRNYVEDTDLGFKRIGFLMETPTQSSRTVNLQYDFTNSLGKEKEYQLIVQKQTGLLNNDFIYQMHVSPPLGVLTTNFTPVVQKAGFVYNTFLEKDRLLLVKFK